MKFEVMFLQYAVSLHCISPSQLAQFFKTHPFASIPENIGDVMVSEGVLQRQQADFIASRVAADVAQPKKHTNSRTIVAITLSDGHAMEIPIPDAQDIFADPQLREQAFTIAGQKTPAEPLQADAFEPASALVEWQTTSPATQGISNTPVSANVSSAPMTVTLSAIPIDISVNADAVNDNGTSLPTANIDRLEPQVAVPRDSLDKKMGATIMPPPATGPVSRIAVGGMFCHYQIQKELGRGGMGVVYKALDTRLSRVVALKLILGGQGVSEMAILRFMQEIRAMAQLQHPHIVKLYEAGDVPQRYFTMEFIEGETLSARNKRQTAKPREAAVVMHKVACAVHYAHGQNIVHRDIKPANIMLDSTQEPRLMDFGTAKISDAQSNLSQPGDMLGTPAYMPPEQAEGGVIDHRVDVYALGATLYDLLVGRPPFQGDSYVNILQQIFRQEPLPPRRLNPDIPVDLEAICLKCLEKDKHKRYADAGLLAQDLKNFLDNKPVTAKPLTVFTYVRKFVLRNKLLCGLSAALVLVLVAGVLFYIHAVRAERDATLAAKLREEKLRGVAEQQREIAEQQTIVARGERQKAVAAQQLAEQQREIAEQQTTIARDERQKAVAAQQLAEQQREIARQNAAWAEKERNEKANEARIALVRLCKIALEKAREAGMGRQEWRQCGSFCATALEFVKNLSGNDIDVLRQECRQLLRQSLVEYGLIWSAETLAIARQVAFTADGASVVIACEDGSVRLWATESGAPGPVIIGHSQQVLSLAIAADGKTIASGSADKTIRLFRLDNPQAVQVLSGHGQQVLCLAFSPDGKTIASGSADKTVRLWDVASGKQLKVCSGHDIAVKSVSFHPGGNLLASAAEDRTIRLWEVPSGNQIKTMAGCLALFSPDGKTIICADPKPTVGLLDSERGGRLKSWSGHLAVVTTLAWSADGTMFASAAGNMAKPDPTVRVWKINQGETVRSFIGETSAVHGIALSPDGKTLASVSQDSRLRLWDISRDRFTRARPLPAWAKEMLPANANAAPGDFAATATGWLEAALQSHPQAIFQRWFACEISDTLTVQRSK